jgi:hypothetical protein
MEKDQPEQQQIQQLLKPATAFVAEETEVKEFCEPNSCTSNCNGGNVLTSPDKEMDILF